MGHERERTLPIDTDCLAALESRIGYRFRDRALLCRALTHSSYSNETGQRNHHLLCNERLEFLGDSVLSLVVSEFLFTTYRELPEGDLTCLRKDVVCADALARYARQIGLGDCLLLGIGEEKTGGRDKVNILADAFEALLAAMFEDAGRGGDAKDVIAAFLLPFVRRDLQELESRGGDGDYKTPAAVGSADRGGCAGVRPDPRGGPRSYEDLRGGGKAELQRHRTRGGPLQA